MLDFEHFVVSYPRQLYGADLA